MDGGEFTPNSLYHIVCGLMRHLKWNEHPSIDFFNDSDFASFKSSLNAEMKRLQSQGLGSKKRQAEVLSEEEEEILWQNGLLGDSTPQTLLDTMVFCNGLYFALRSGQEHRQLRLRPCQIEIIENDGKRPYLKYTEDISKNRQGGIKGRNMKPKIVYHHASIDNPARCFVRLFKMYTQLCPDIPKELNAFYLQPMKTPTVDCWYTCRPLGHNTIAKTISRLCANAGITGYKTNHSLRATAATRLYQSAVDEQLIMERTGHRSLEGVRSYKRTSDEQREYLSDILNRKEPRIEETPTSKGDSCPQQQTSTPQVPDVGSAVVVTSTHQVPDTGAVVAFSPSTQHSTTNIQSNTKNSLPGSFTFNSCSTVNFNIHY